MAVLSELLDRVLRMLGDPAGDAYSEGLLRDAISAAFDAIMPWTPNRASTTLTSGSTTVVLPTDCYAIDAVTNSSTGIMYPRAVLDPNTYFGNQISAENTWIEYPAGSITFAKSLSANATLYYLAYWDKPTEDSDPDLFEVAPPEYAYSGIVLYSAAYCLLPAGVGASEIRQFGTKVDSGNPEHNPMQKSAEWLMKLFTNEMNRHPKFQRSSP